MSDLSLSRPEAAPAIPLASIEGHRGGQSFVGELLTFDPTRDGFEMSFELLGAGFQSEPIVLKISGARLPRRSRPKPAGEGPYVLCRDCGARVPITEGRGPVGYVVFTCPDGCGDFGPGVA